MPINESFTIAQIQEFQRLSKRLAQIAAWKKELLDKMAVIERQMKRAAEEEAAIHSRIKDEYASLASVASLFSTSAVPDTALSIEHTGYITKDKKRLLLARILEDYRKARPEAETMTYSEVKSILEREYSITTRSITNFFLGILCDYKTVGGNKNKAIVMPGRNEPGGGPVANKQGQGRVKRDKLPTQESKNPIKT